MRGKGRQATDWLADIVLWGEKLQRYVADRSFEAFAADDMAVDAATKCIEAIGEAANRLLREAPELHSRYPALPLREAYQVRNQLSHGYFLVDRKLLWQMAHSAVPDLVADVRKVLFDMQTGRET